MSLSLVPGTLPEDWCQLEPQEQWNSGIAGVQITGSADPAIVFADAEPGVNDRDKAWGLLRADGTFSPYIFTYANGQWGVEHEYTPTSDIRIMWSGSEADLWSFDGGDGTDPSVPANLGPYIGAMWERDTAFDGRSPMGPGAIEDSDPAKTLALGESYGAGSVTLTSAQAFQMQAHQHVFGRFSAIANDDGNFTFDSTTPPYPTAAALVGRVVTGDVNNRVTNPLSALAGEYQVTSPAYNPSTGDLITGITNTPHETVHPVHGVFFAQRTARIYRTPVNT